MGEARTEPAENFSQGAWILVGWQVESFLKSMITLGKQKKFLEKLDGELGNRDWKTAEQLYGSKFFKDRSNNMEVKRLFSEFELKRFLGENKSAFRKNLKRLLEVYNLLLEVEKYYKMLKALGTKANLFVEARDLSRQAKEQRKQTEKVDPKQMIELMKKAKMSMNKVVNLTSSFSGSIPIVSDLVRFYGQFFIATDKIFDKVGAYAGRIIEETEKIPNVWANGIGNVYVIAVENDITMGKTLLTK